MIIIIIIIIIIINTFKFYIIYFWKQLIIYGYKLEKIKNKNNNGIKYWNY